MNSRWFIRFYCCLLVFLVFLLKLEWVWLRINIIHSCRKKGLCNLYKLKFIIFWLLLLLLLIFLVKLFMLNICFPVIATILTQDLLTIKLLNFKAMKKLYNFWLKINSNFPILEAHKLYHLKRFSLRSRTMTIN